MKWNKFLFLNSIVTPKYTIGNRGGVACPPGSQLITDQGECQNKAAVALGKKYKGANCWAFKAKGCFDNKADVYFSTCNTKNTEAHHGPVCGPVQGKFPLFFERTYTGINVCDSYFQKITREQTFRKRFVDF